MIDHNITGIERLSIWKAAAEPLAVLASDANGAAASPLPVALAQK
jgi:hypothetical protein